MEGEHFAKWFENCFVPFTGKLGGEKILF